MRISGGVGKEEAMNEKFFELPEEKQMRIINAGFDIFSRMIIKGLRLKT
jgi:hypothetical protein